MLRIFNKNIKHGGYSDNQTGQTVSKSRFEEILLDKPKRWMKEELKKTEPFPFLVHILGGNSGIPINCLNLI